MNNPTCFKLFVYGSLRRGFNSPAYDYMSQYFDFVAPAKVSGKLYDLGEYPAAISDEPPAFIIGELYAIKQEQEFDWAMAQLDDYEGVFPGYDEPALYHRTITSAILETGENINAWVYWYAGSVEGKSVVASGDVLQYNAEKEKKS